MVGRAEPAQLQSLSRLEHPLGKINNCLYHHTQAHPQVPTSDKFLCQAYGLNLFNLSVCPENILVSIIHASVVCLSFLCLPKKYEVLFIYWEIEVICLRTTQLEIRFNKIDIDIDLILHENTVAYKRLTRVTSYWAFACKFCTAIAAAMWSRVDANQ